MNRAILKSFLLLSLLSGCASYRSQVSHHVEPLNEASIASDMVAALTRALPPKSTSIYLYPAKNKTTTEVFDQALRDSGYKVEPVPTEGSAAIVLLASGLEGEKSSTYCLRLINGEICREYFGSSQPIGPFSASVDLEPLTPIVEAKKIDVVGEGVVWFANDRGKLGPKGTAQTQKLIAEFLSSGAQSIQVTGVSSGRTAIGNSQLAEDRAQSVAAMFFDAGVAASDIQIQAIAETKSNDLLPDRAAIVKYLRERGPLDE